MGEQLFRTPIYIISSFGLVLAIENVMCKKTLNYIYLYSNIVCFCLSLHLNLKWKDLSSLQPRKKMLKHVVLFLPY